MLLKHNRKQPTYKEGGNSSTIQRTAMQVRQQQVIGTYTTKDQRIETKNEIQRAHFHMGFDTKQMPSQSYGQELIDASAGHVNEQTILNNATDMANRKENSRKSNFNVGHIPAKSNKDKYAVDTASRSAFKPEYLAMHKAPEKVQKDFRGGKLYMGSSGNEYTTTNNDNFSDQLLQDRLKNLNKVDQAAEKQERMMKHRMQQFSYGHDTPNYQSMAKKDFQEYGVNSMANNISKISSQQVRETHFHFGNDQFIHQTTKGPELNNWSPGKDKQKDKCIRSDSKDQTKKQQLDMKSVNQKSNFKIGKGQLVQNQFLSMQKQAMDSVKNKSGIQSSNAPEFQSDIRNEVQKTHFNLGTSQLDYVSYNVGTMVEHPITKESVMETGKNRKMAIDSMRNANFRIPNQQVLKTGVSTYKQNISDLTEENKLAGQKARLLTNLKQSSVKIGENAGKLQSSTEQGDQFINPNFGSNRGEDVKQNAQMKTYLKGHHFELGYKNLRHSAQGTGPQSVISQNQTPNSNHYMNQQFRESVQEKNKFKRDQGSHHFQMGYEFRPTTAKSQNDFTLQKHLSNQVGSGSATLQVNRGVASSHLAGSNNNAGRLNVDGQNKQRFASSKPATDQTSSRQIQDMVNKNRASNIVYGQGNANTGRGQTVKTVNQAYYKWIQPVK